MDSCLFCNINRKVQFENTLAYVVMDSFPVSRGHMLVIPKRHYASFFDSCEQEILAIYSLIHEAKTFLDSKYNPDGYNIGINDGEHAGQSIFHLHIHIIPRYKGDVQRPKGGIRNLIPLSGKPNCPYKEP